MKILAITMNVGKTVPGIVSERIIQGISFMHNIDILTAEYKPSIDLPNVSKIVISKKCTPHPRIEKLLISIFGVSPYDWFWAWKSKKQLKSARCDHYDIIISYLSFQNYAALITGKYLSKRYKSKYAVHCLDAIPAPFGWLNYDWFYKGLIKMMKKYLSSIDALFSTNHQMLNYQLSTFKPKKNLITSVIYTPGQNKVKLFPRPDQEINNFVYTGGIYGLRKSKYILDGFEKLLEVYPSSKLVFIGSLLSSLSLSGLKPETLLKIEIFPFTFNLEPYYNCATALLDIDADIDKDVFLSSKVTNYIMINRIIICETGINSPAHNLFKDIDSIILCSHDSDQLCEAMKQAILLKQSISFNDRNKVIRLFQIENIVDQLNKSFQLMVAT
jgi:hypothetical protein